MDKRATHRSTGTLGAPQKLASEASDRTGRTVIDGAGHEDASVLGPLLRAIAVRLDVVLDEKVASGAEPEGRHRAARAWSSVVGRPASDETAGLRRQALNTTVLRISADGGTYVGGSVDDASAEAIDDRSMRSDATATTVAPVDLAEPVEPVGNERYAISEPPMSVAPERSGVEDRLRTVRERLATRRASTSASPRAARSVRPSVWPSMWQRTDVRTLIQRLLIGLTIVGASAVVSILVT